MTNITPTLEKPAPPGLTDILEALKREIFKEINAVKIGVIQSFDPGDTNNSATVSVKIAQQQVVAIKPDGTSIIQEYPILLKVPVFFPCGGGFTLTFPIAQGDECIVLFNDREIDNWLAGGAGSTPITARMHDLSDGFALVGVRSNSRPLSGISIASTQLRSDDGKTFVEVKNGGLVNVTAPTKITLTAPEVDIIASSKVVVTTPETDISGILDVQNVDSSSNPCTINGSIHATGDIVAETGSANVSLAHHVHSGVQSGGSNTGQPV